MAIDKNKTAIALTYDRGVDPAPTVSAKGKGYVAEQIIALAKEHGIEVRQDADLAQMLDTVDIDTPIPMEAYVAVAEILSYIYGVNSDSRKMANPRRMPGSS